MYRCKQASPDSAQNRPASDPRSLVSRMPSAAFDGLIVAAPDRLTPPYIDSSAFLASSTHTTTSSSARSALSSELDGPGAQAVAGHQHRGCSLGNHLQSACLRRYTPPGPRADNDTDSDAHRVGCPSLGDDASLKAFVILEGASGSIRKKKTAKPRY